MKHIHTFENFSKSVKEMAAGDIHVQAILSVFDAGDMKEKERIAQIVSGKKHYDRKKIIDDLAEVGYQEILDLEKEIGINEAFNFSLSSNAKAAIDVINAIEKNSKFLKESDMAEMLDTFSATLKKVGYLGLEDYK
jgi:hypothetical protein